MQETPPEFAAFIGIDWADRKHDFFVIFPVNPSMLAEYREAFTPSRAKDERAQSVLPAGC